MQRYLNSALIRWSRCRFRFPDDAITEKYDAIIMVNWIHLPRGVAKEHRATCPQDLVDNGKIVLDTVEST
jgi:hypothetical protein